MILNVKVARSVLRTEADGRRVAWGLRRDGQVVPLDTDPEGDVGDPRETKNFHRVERAVNGHNKRRRRR